MKNKWWGYRHSSETYQAKRYFDIRDIEDARESSFVEQICGPFEADSREEALQIIRDKIG